MASWILAELDVYDKTEDGALIEPTRIGRYITLLVLTVSSLCLASVVIGAVRGSFYRELLNEPVISDEHDLVNISLSVVVGLPCYFLHVDAMDAFGTAQLNLNSTVTLRRLSRGGRVIGVSNASISDRCGPCYGLLPPGACCDSCGYLTALARMKGAPVDTARWEQCRRGPAPVDVSVSERCLVKGKITVNRVAGGFHIAAATRRAPRGTGTRDGSRSRTSRCGTGSSASASATACRPPRPRSST